MYLRRTGHASVESRISRTRRCLHRLGGDDTDQVQRVGEDLARGGGEFQAGGLQGLIVGQDAQGAVVVASVVPGLGGACQFVRVVRDVVRRQVARGELDHFGQLQHAANERQLGGL